MTDRQAGGRVVTNQPPQSAPAAADWLAGGGEMAERMRASDWSATPLGAVETWPQSLKTAVRILLNSRYPMFVWWGRELTKIYNDAYIPMLGARHPQALGQSARRIWADVWPVVGPQTELVMGQGRATWNDSILLLMERYGFIEETYFTFSYSPVPDDTGRVGGVFCACTEDTRRVLGERRLKTLRDLGERSLTEARTADQVCRAAAATLAENPHDFPFALIYLLDEDGRQARLCEAINLAVGTKASPATINVDSGDDVWNFRRVLDTKQSHVVETLAEQFGRLPAGPWADDWTRRAIVLPLAKTGVQEFLAGYLVAGIGPRLAFNDDYRSFLELAAKQLATAIANARAYEEERKRVEALAELDRAKTAFFSNVSHEFRTPLTLMLGPLEDALSDLAHPLSSDHRDRLETSHRNSLRLLKLVNTLLDFSRIEAGRVQACYEPTDLSALTAELASTFRSACERAGLRLVVDSAQLPEPIYVDREMWEKIVLNLLSNAFKFTFAGEIAVSLRAADGAVELAVRDTGTGIPANELPHLFERFHRVQGARGRTHEGTGIGLALVQELVNLHGGSVRVESVVGRGSTFAVSIPTGRAHLSADRIGAARTLATTALGAGPYIEEALRWLPDPDSSRLAPPEAGLDPALTSLSRAIVVTGKGTKAADRRGRILWADDNADMRDYVRRLLGAHYDVEAVADGKAALAAARARRPDLVLADVMMPQLDGFELLRELRADPETRTLPVILLSGRAGEESRVGGLEAGADDYLIKPFSARELLARVGAHLEMARIRREAEERLRESEERLRLALSAGKFGNWELDLANMNLTSSTQCRANFGGAPDEPFTYEMFRASIHPQDREMVEAAVSKAIEEVCDYEADYRCVWPDGSIHWINARGRTVAGEDGRAARMAGVTLDITERKRVEETLRRLVECSQLSGPEFFQALVRTMAETLGARQAFVAEIDPERRERARTIALWADGAAGAPLEYALAGTPGQAVIAQHTCLYQGGVATRFPKDILLAEMGVESYLGTPLRASDGRTIGLLVALHDQAFDEARQPVAMVELFSGRAAAELERQQAEEARKAMLARAQAARAEAEAANRMKDEFLATLSHELRTPLNAVLGWTTMLRKGGLDETMERRGLEVIERNVFHQNQLISDLLDVSRIITGKMTVETRPVHLPTVIQTLTDSLRPAAEAKRITIISDVDQYGGPIWGDADRIQQVVWNLLSNAVKFTPERGRIDVRLTRPDGTARIEVRDTGKGIRPEFLPHIFERFRQADSSTTRAHAGLGLGLAIVRHLVELHGGTVTVESAGEGLGATFIVTLPVAPRRQADPASSPRVTSDAPPPRSSPDLAGVRVLLVDDDPDTCDLLATILEVAGADVIAVRSADAARAILDSRRPHVLVSDLAMPDQDGFALIRHIRSRPADRGGRIPALALTAYARPEDRERTMAAGFQAYLSKPVEPATLVEEVATLAGKPHSSFAHTASHRPPG